MLYKKPSLFLGGRFDHNTSSTELHCAVGQTLFKSKASWDLWNTLGPKSSPAEDTKKHFTDLQQTCGNNALPTHLNNDGWVSKSPQASHGHSISLVWSCEVQACPSLGTGGGEGIMFFHRFSAFRTFSGFSESQLVFASGGCYVSRANIGSSCKNTWLTDTEGDCWSNVRWNRETHCRHWC